MTRRARKTVNSSIPDQYYAARPGYLIKLAQAALHAEMAHALQAHGATLAQYAVLAALAEEPGQSNADLARRAFITPQSMNENLRELERRAWIVRRQHPGHGRIQQAELTDSGRTIWQKCDTDVHAIEERMLAGLDVDQRRRLTQALQACVNALTDVSSVPDR
jgi:DNA-binding MarR family transcriptional regulator